MTATIEQSLACARRDCGHPNHRWCGADNCMTQAHLHDHGEDRTMTSTIPTTLDEYKEFARQEALRVQKDMNWPDEKLNATLRALGLPEKQRHVFTATVTATRKVSLVDDESLTREEAEAKLLDRAKNDPRFVGYQVQAVEALPEGAVDDRVYQRGDEDDTLLAQGVDRSGWCGSTNPNGYTCTREPGHGGNHAAGYGRNDVIGRVWDL